MLSVNTRSGPLYHHHCGHSYRWCKFGLASGTTPATSVATRRRRAPSAEHQATASDLLPHRWAPRFTRCTFDMRIPSFRPQCKSPPICRDTSLTPRVHSVQWPYASKSKYGPVVLHQHDGVDAPRRFTLAGCGSTRLPGRTLRCNAPSLQICQTLRGGGERPFVNLRMEIGA